MPIQVLFVCLGNICRSPTAHGLFQYKVDQAELSQQILVDSAGTGAWHSGSPPDERAQRTAIDRGYDISHLRARQVTAQDFATFDYILAMDNENYTHLEVMKPSGFKGVLGYFLEVGNLEVADTGVIGSQRFSVPDPYYGGEQHFHHPIELIEAGANGLLKRIRQEHGL